MCPYKSIVVGGETQPPVYAWDFGDGITLGIAVGYFSQDFGSHLDPDKFHNIFQMTVKVIESHGITMQSEAVESCSNQKIIGR
jgi:hypothetical protein